MMEKAYLHEYDDPYWILATSLISVYSIPILKRIMTDDVFVRKMVAEETYAQDIRGMYLDCIVENINSDKRRVEHRHQLDKLAGYYYDNLDMVRRRKSLQDMAELCGISLDE